VRPPSTGNYFLRVSHCSVHPDGRTPESGLWGGYSVKGRIINRSSDSAEIKLTPDRAFVFKTIPDSNLTDVLVVANIGKGELRYTVNDTAGWITFSSSGGTIPAGKEDSLKVTIKTPGNGIFRNLIEVRSNDMLDPQKNIVVKLTVKSGVNIKTNLHFAENIGLRAWPNPFNPSTTISFFVNASGKSELRIVNLKGELVRVWTKLHSQAGEFRLLWDGKNTSGKMMASGVYFVELSTFSRGIIKRRKLNLFLLK